MVQPHRRILHIAHIPRHQRQVVMEGRRCQQGANRRTRAVRVEFTPQPCGRETNVQNALPGGVRNTLDPLADGDRCLLVPLGS